MSARVVALGAAARARTLAQLSKAFPAASISLPNSPATEMLPSSSSRVRRIRNDTGQRLGIHDYKAAQHNITDKDVFIALGGNIGDRVQNISLALQQLKEEGIEVIAHSGLFESAPAYVTDQPAFLNAVVRARTDLPPPQLLRALKGIEQRLGRQKGGIRFGPRPIDLDIILYRNWCVRLDDPDYPLEIPHARMLERDFVMVPLSDLMPHTSTADSSGTAAETGGKGPTRTPVFVQEDYIEGQSPQNVVNAWWRDKAKSGTAATALQDENWEGLQRVMPSAGKLLRWTVGEKSVGGKDIVEESNVTSTTPGENGSRRTKIMGILNITPDSFSDGGVLSSVSTAVEAAAAMLEAGVCPDILDVGGQSTRPGAIRLTPEEELQRVLPVIVALRADTRTRGTLISVDTFYAEVARKAVAAGADIVNDISGGTMDDDMLDVVAELGVPYILGHIRGDPQTMTKPENTSYTDVVQEVAAELSARAEVAMSRGVPGWNLLLDPGIGFAKSYHGNLTLLKELNKLRSSLSIGTLRYAPLVVGPSRKGFLGKAAGVKDAAERDWATAAAVAASVAGGADIVRVHNVRAMADVVKVSDAIWKTNYQAT